MDSQLRCRLLHHNNPFTRLGPFQIEEQSLQPYLIVIKGLMGEQEMDHYKDKAVDEVKLAFMVILPLAQLERSGHGGGKGSTTSLKRTSKQTWLEHRAFNFSLSDLSAVLGTNDAETNKTLKENLQWASIMVRPETLVSTDSVIQRISDRMERATATTLLSPISAEAFQVTINPQHPHPSRQHHHQPCHHPQVANYGLGGQYSQHTDPHGYWEGKSADPTHQQTGDRLMTIMVYLTQVTSFMTMTMTIL